MHACSKQASVERARGLVSRPGSENRRCATLPFTAAAVAAP